MMQHQPAHPQNQPFVSVIVPAYHDWPRVAQLCEALKKQTLGLDRFEVVLVNNDPGDPPPASLSLPAEWHLVSEAQPGSYAARNRGLTRSQGDVVAFTDSDCTPDAQWLENGLTHLLSGAGRVAGRVKLTYRGARLNWVEKYEKAYAFPQQRYVDEGVSVTANLITWRRHFDDVGYFNSTLLSGGDTEWGLRATSAGVPILYAADVVVAHPARSGLRELLTKRRRLAAAALNVRAARSGAGLFVMLLRGIMPPVQHCRALAKRGDLTFGEKASALSMVYLLKVYGTWHRILLLTGRRQPERR